MCVCSQRGRIPLTPGSQSETDFCLATDVSLHICNEAEPGEREERLYGGVTNERSSKRESTGASLEEAETVSALFFRHQPKYLITVKRAGTSSPKSGFSGYYTTHHPQPHPPPPSFWN
ncbi:hypothetical protein EYF80_065357 [Liparis tanakae]|uniref:Uncharacterized protein n=1 Tax=Liparis tanakae TaxID=230148 RepID=A0A4Z2E6X5_9TELE|nr:hypothetical protein EYF80_065357 [Liparis tanakae]